MSIFCIKDLAQFIIFYFLMLYLFTYCFYILGEEVYQLGPGLDGVAQNLSYFQKLYLFQYQTSLEYLYVPYYNESIFG